MIKLEGYKILKKLGSGGMGDVYLAEHEVLETRVAIKSLHLNLVNDENFKKRFRGEAKVHAKLNHSNIVKLIDFQERKNGLFIVMEYVEGKQLDEYIINESGPIPEKELIPLFCQILDAISHAHSKDLVHRDIKPANIIINEGKIKILDFGIAKDTSTELGLTRTGVQVGTPMFMSPEQINGEKINKLTDIYSLGVTLFYMAVGKPPYENTNAIKLGVQVLTEDFPNPKDIYPWVSDKLSDVINKATQKKKSDRYQSCYDFRDNLESKDEKIIKTEITETKKKKKNNAIIIGSIILLISSFSFILFNKYISKEVVAEDAKYQTLFVKDKKAYFHLSYYESSKLSSYVILNDELNCGYDTINGFIDCIFTNDENRITKGYIKIKKLKKQIETSVKKTSQLNTKKRRLAEEARRAQEAKEKRLAEEARKIEEARKVEEAKEKESLLAFLSLSNLYFDNEYLTLNSTGRRFLINLLQNNSRGSTQGARLISGEFSEIEILIVDQKYIVFISRIYDDYYCDIYNAYSRSFTFLNKKLDSKVIPVSWSYSKLYNILCSDQGVGFMFRKNYFKLSQFVYSSSFNNFRSRFPNYNDDLSYVPIYKWE